jgi:DNA-binding XRE family transcriptional regulator
LLIDNWALRVYLLLMDIEKELLKKKGERTWTDFAKAVGLSRQALLSLRTGRFKPSYYTLQKLGLIPRA